MKVVRFLLNNEQIKIIEDLYVHKIYSHYSEF